METHTFNNYGANQIILNGQYNFLYSVDKSGQYAGEMYTVGQVDISGYFKDTAYHIFTINLPEKPDELPGFHNWIFVGDYPSSWTIHTFLITVTIGK